MPTKWFFDAAGTDAGSRILVLSGVGGSEAMWQNLNTAWRAALDDLQIEVWHSTDYFRRRGRAEKAELPKALLNVIGRQIQQEFNCISFAVDKQASEASRIQYRELIPPDEQMLMELCFSGLGAAREDRDQPDCITILFDRDEPFIHHLKSSWDQGRKYLRRERKGGWPLQVRQIEPASSKDHAGLQVADLLSWTLRCRYEYGDKMVDPKIPMIMLMFAPQLRGGFLNLPNIEARYVHKRSVEFSHGYSFM
jgi:Protein of unknown function (DUF3800)